MFEQELAEKKREFFATVNGVEYCVEVRDGTWRDEKIVWVTVKQLEPGLNWWKSILSHGVAVECVNDLEALRNAFRDQRTRMRTWLQSWLQWRFEAAREHGGKRGYYTRLANDARKQALGYAPGWKLCKALWKEITKL